MSLTRPLTRPLTRKISRADLTQGFGGSFSPFALNPYLLFDARDSMVGTLENPTLDLNPALPETLDVITATRAGTATFTDANGNIATAPANTVRVDQTQGAELTPTKFQRIENTDFSSWSHARTSGTANAAISPDGQNNATYVEQNVGETNAGSIYRIDASFTGVFTLSVYAKKKEKNFIVLYDSNTDRAYFNLENGTVGTVQGGNTANIEDAGNGWFRCSVTFTASSGTVKAFYVGDTDNSLVVTGGGGIYIYGPQLEEGTTASSFVANTTGIPKFITGATFGPRVPMILVEPSATNLVTYSEDFSNAAWIKSAVGTGVAPVVTLNAAESPDGTQNATKIVFDSGSGTTTNDLSTLEDYFNTTSGTSYTQSIYLKGESGGEKILLRNAGNSSYTTVTLTTEWARYSVTETAALNFGYYSIGLRQGLGGVVINSKITVYAYGAQVESGSVATSLIRTAGSNVTRAADDLVISGSAFSGFFNASQGTTYMETVPKSNSNTPHYFEYFNSSNAVSNRMGVYTPVNGFNYFIAGVTNQSMGAVNLNQVNRLAVSYKVNDLLGSLNGASELAVTSAALPTGIDTLRIGNAALISGSYNASINGHIKRLIVWPYHSDSL